MRLLVTGGTGQIGGAIVHALVERGDSVRVLVRDETRPGHMSGFELYEGDITDASSLDGACDGVEAVIHAAGVVSYWPRGHALMEQVHVDGTANLLKAATRAGVQRFVHTSSMACFGYVEGGGIGSEDTEYNWNPFNIGYCETKKAAEELVLGWSDVECVAVNPGITLGPGDVNGNGIRLLARLKAGQFRGIPPGSTTLAGLQDVVAGHLAALERGRPGQRYHLGGHPMSWEDAFKRASKVVDAPLPPRRVTRAQMMVAARLSMVGGWLTGQEPKLPPQLVQLTTRNRMYDCAKAKAELGYTVSSLEGAMSRAWHWYCETHSLDR